MNEFVDWRNCHNLSRTDGLSKRKRDLSVWVTSLNGPRRLEYRAVGAGVFFEYGQSDGEELKYDFIFFRWRLRHSQAARKLCRLRNRWKSMVDRKYCLIYHNIYYYGLKTAHKNLIYISIETTWKIFTKTHYTHYTLHYNTHISYDFCKRKHSRRVCSLGLIWLEARDKAKAEKLLHRHVRENVLLQIFDNFHGGGRI